MITTGPIIKFCRIWFIEQTIILYKRVKVFFEAKNSCSAFTKKTFSPAIDAPLSNLIGRFLFSRFNFIPRNEPEISAINSIPRANNFHWNEVE